MEAFASIFLNFLVALFGTFIFLWIILNAFIWKGIRDIRKSGDK